MKRKPGGGTRRLVITIDGPGGVGKSTVASILAKELGLPYLDTGATYRALALAALHAGLHPITQVKQIAALARELPLRLRTGAQQAVRVLLDGLDVTAAIRSEEVTEAAAQISQHPEVRGVMVQRQREWAGSRGVIAEGRDAGSVIFPDASYKFFLNASLSVRAKRRQRELSRRYGARVPLGHIQEQLQFRDTLDRTRRVGPLIRPEGAVTIDTSTLSARGVARIIRRYLGDARLPGRGGTS